MRRRFVILANAVTMTAWMGCGERPVAPVAHAPLGWILTQQNAPVQLTGRVGMLSVGVENETGSSQTIQSVQIAGPGSSVFTLASRLPITLASGTAVTLTAQFAPIYPATSTATFEILTTDGTAELPITAQSWGELQDGPDCGIAPEFDAGVPLGSAAVGQSMVLEVPVAESADVGETILGANVEGTFAGDFTVESMFPMDVPAGVTVNVSLRFTPSQQGQEWVQLDLLTQAMGTSIVVVSALGTAP